MKIRRNPNPDFIQQLKGTIQSQSNTNRSFYPDDRQPAYTDPGRQPRRDGEWEGYRRNEFMLGGESTAGGWESKFSLDALFSKIQTVSPNAQKVTDALGRNVISVNQMIHGEQRQAHIHLDPQTGGLSVNRADNPGGGFFVLDRITNMQPLQGQQFGSRDAFVSAAQGAGVYQNKVDYLTSIIGGHRDVVGTVRGSLSAMMQDEGQSPFQSYHPDELTAQQRTRWATSISLPSHVSDDNGALKKLYSNDYANFMQSTGLSSFFGIKSGSSKMMDLGAMEASNYAVNESGMIDMNKPKRDTQRGGRGMLPLYSEPSAAGRVPQMTSPFRYEGEVEAARGYKQNYLYTMHNILTPEGQGFIRENAGYLRRNFTSVVNLPEGGLDALGISANSVYGDLPLGEGQTRGENLRGLEQLLGRSFGSYQGVSLDQISVDGNRATITGGSYISQSGTSRKYKQKGMMSVTPDDSGIIPQGFDAVMGVSNPEDLAGIGERALAGRYDSTANFRNAFIAYAAGYGNLSSKMQSWVDDNAGWVKNAPGAGGYSEAKARRLIGQNAIIGGANAGVFANMSRDFALSQMDVQEWQNQQIDAATYAMHKNTMIGDRPALENVSLASGSGDSAIYNVGTVRDYALPATVLDQMQPEFDRGVATLPAESLDKMARYNPEMYQYINNLVARGAVNNPAADIITAVRANYGGAMGESARAALNDNGELAFNQRRSVINLDDASNRYDFAGMYTKISGDMQGASEGAISEEFLRQVAQQTGNHALQMGNIVLPSAKAGLNTFTLNEDGEAITNLGSQMSRALVAHSNVMQARELGGGEEFTRQRDELAYSALQEAAQLMEPSNPNETAQEFIKSATGVTTPVIASAAIGSKMLVPGSVAIPQDTLFEQTGARTAEERQQVLARMNSGELSAMTQMFPEANSKHMAIQSRIFTTEQINKQYGRQVLSNENAMYMSEQNAFALAKDFDRDTQRTILSGRFVGEGDNRQWVAADVKPQSAEDVMSIVRNSVGGELGKQEERAAWNMSDYAAAARNVSWKSISQVGGKYLETLRAKADMGTMYNIGIRGFTRFGEILADRAGIGNQNANADRVQEALSGFSQYPYQAAIDLEVANDPSLRKIVAMGNSLNFESSKGSGRSSSWFFDRTSGEAMEVKGSKNKNALAADIMKTFASVGLDSSDIDASASPEERQAALAAKVGKYKANIAPHLAVGMLPMNATEEQRSAAQDYLNQYADQFGGSGELGAFDTRHFATSIAGKKSELHWLAGAEGDDLAALAPLSSFVAGASAANLEKKNGSKIGALVGRMGQLGGIFKQVGAFYDTKNARTVEEAFAGMAGQAPEVTAHSSAAVARMGGVGNGLAASGQIAHLNPNNAQELAAEVQSVAAANPVTVTEAAPEEAPLPSISNYVGDNPDGISDAMLGAVPVPPRSGGGSVPPPPSDMPVAIAAPPPSGGGSGGGTIINNITRPAPLPALKENEVQRAYSSARYLQSNMGRIPELAAMAKGGDIKSVSGEIDAILTAAGHVQSVRNKGGALRAVGVRGSPALEMAEGFFDPGSEMNADALLGGISGDISTLNDTYNQFRLNQKAQRKSRVSADSLPLSAGEMGETEGLLDKFTGNLKEMRDVLEGVTKGQKEHIEKSKELTKTYEALAQTADRIEAKGEAAPDDEKSLAGRIRSAGVGGSALGGAMNNLAGTTNYMVASGQVAENTLSSEERSQRVMDAILSGGRGGAKKRGRLSDADWAGAEEETGMSREFLSVAGGAARFAGHAQSLLWAGRQLQRTLLAPLQQDAAFYTNREQQNSQTLMSSGLVSYGDMMGGTFGDIRRRAAQMDAFQVEEGRQVYNTYNGLFGMMSGQVAGRNVGMMSSIASPAIAGAVIGTQLGGPFGGLIGGGIGAAGGLAAWGAGASRDTQGAATYLQNYMAGKAGGDVAGFATFALNSIFNPQDKNAVMDQAVGQMLSSNYVGGSDVLAGRGSDTTISRLMQAGMTRSQAEITLRDQFNIQAAADFGIESDKASQIYSFQRTYLGGQSMSGRAMKSLTGYMASGVMGLSDAAQSVMAGGGSQFDAGRVGAEALAMTAHLDAVAESGGNVALEQGYLNANQGRRANVNQARRMGGLSTVGNDYLINDPYRNDPMRAGMRDQLDMMMSGLRGRDTNLGTAAMGFLSLAGNQYLQNNDLRGMNQYMNQFGQAFNMGQGYMMYGMSGGNAAFIADQAGKLNATQFNQFQAAAGGDRMMLSQLASQGRMSRKYATIDMQTGAGIYDYDINAAEYGEIAKYAGDHGMIDMLPGRDMMKGGTVGMQKSIRDENLKAYERNYAFQTTQRNLSYAMMTGGSKSLNPSGFAVGMDNLDGVASIFAQQGMAFNRGNGMGQWQIQDVQTRIARDKQIFGMQQEGQQLVMAQQQFTLQGQQFYENMNLRQAQFDYNTNYQRNEMNISRRQTLRSREWQQEDMSFQRDRSQLSFGWQMEDFDRNMRYAQGRERQDLLRERSRAVITQNMNMGQMDREQSRFTEQNKWSDEKFARDKEHFEKTTQFQKQSMDMDVKHFEQNRKFDQQQLQMREQAHAKAIQWMNQEFVLDDQSRLLERQNAELQFKMQTDIATATHESDTKIRQWNEGMQLTNATMKAKNDLIAIEAANGKLATEALAGLNKQLVTIAATLNGRGSSSTSSTAATVASGSHAYTPDAGVSVSNSNTAHLDTLKQIHETLIKIKDKDNTPVIYNADGSKTPVLNPKDQAYSRMKQ